MLSKLEIRFEKSGFSAIELVIVIAIFAIFVGIILRFSFRFQNNSMEDQRTSVFYTTMGLLMEAIHMDSAMAKQIIPTSDGFEIALCSSTITDKIHYSIGTNGITRTFRGSVQYFDFGKPLKPGAKLIFKIQEEKKL
ncbi:MAG: type II secretion system protein [Candidatus Riflebacteria bacterium]|nr:type II secretion system protein [Candidatus Riflebacteria bacterium]